MPALYSLAFRRLLPERFAVVGAARTPGTDESFREAMKEAVQQHARDEFRQDVWDELAPGCATSQLDDAEDSAGESLVRAARPDRPRARHAGEPALLLRGPAARDRPARREGRRGPLRRAAGSG